MTEMRWLDAEQTRAWLRFAAVLELLPAALDSQLTRDADLTHFDYVTLVMLSEAPERTLRMTALAARTNATLPRLSRVVARLEREGYVERRNCPDDGRATNAVLTAAGLAKLTEAAPGHLATVRHYVIDALTPTQLDQLSRNCARMLTQLDPTGRMFSPPQGPGRPRAGLDRAVGNDDP